MVEKFFQKPIISFYYDNGGEFITLKELFQLHDISQFLNIPHKPKHNGYTKHCHRHIRETGLSLLSYVGLPFTFWTCTISITIYLINRLPTPTLGLCFPFQKLFKKDPQLQQIRYSWLSLLSLD